MRRQRGPLQVRQDTRRRSRSSRRRRPCRAHARDRRGRCRRRGAPPRRCRAPIAERRAWRPTGRPASAPVDDEDVARVEPSVRDPGRVQRGHLLARDPRAARRSPDRRVSSGSTSGWRVTTNASPSGPRAAVDDPGHANAGLRGHQRGERLVLDLLEAADRCAPRMDRGTRAGASGAPAVACPPRRGPARAP